MITGRLKRVHDDAPTPAPTPTPSLACPDDESLYKIRLTDSDADGWEGATYQVVGADGTVAANGTLSDGGSDLLYVCLPDGSYELEFSAPTGLGDDAGDDTTGSDDRCAEVAGSNGGSHSGCVSGSDDEGDTSFTAVGGVVHDDAPTPVPSPAPTLNPSPECPGGESLYKLLLTDGASDGWEGATYRVVDADGTAVAYATKDGSSKLHDASLVPDARPEDAMRKYERKSLYHGTDELRGPTIMRDGFDRSFWHHPKYHARGCSTHRLLSRTNGCSWGCSVVVHRRF